MRIKRWILMLILMVCVVTILPLKGNVWQEGRLVDSP
jgi:hypothetical protein